MGRRSGWKPDFFYCPKCGQKKLRRMNVLVVDGSRLTWQCTYAPGGKQISSAPPCGLVISHPSRDAEISDYEGGLLDRMVVAADGELVKLYLLEHNPNIRKRGLEVLYSGGALDLVRLNDNKGIAAYIILKENWDGVQKLWALTSPASRHIKFRDVELHTISNGSRYCLWALKNTGHLQGAAPFKGKMTKDMRTQLVEWAAALDHEFPRMRARVIIDNARWVEETKQLRAELPKPGKVYVQLVNYNGATGLANINVRGGLTPDQVRAIAAIVAPQPAVGS